MEAAFEIASSSNVSYESTYNEDDMSENADSSELNAYELDGTDTFTNEKRDRSKNKIYELYQEYENLQAALEV
jgi:hypothetical protein